MFSIKLKNKSYPINKTLPLAINFIYWELFHPLYITPSRIIFGNTIGFRKNLIPKLDSFIRKFSHKNTNLKIKKDVSEFREVGYIKLKRFEKVLIEKVFNEFNECVKNPETFVKKQTRVLANPPAYIIDPVLNMPSIKSLLDLELDNFLREYFRGNYKVINVSSWRNYSNDTQNPHIDIGISNGFHFDGVPNNILQLFILLSDGVNKETGATKIINIKNSKKITRQPFNFSRKFVSQRILNQMLKHTEYCSGDIGEAYLINTQECLHGAGVPTDGSFRNVLTFTFQSCKENIDFKNLLSALPEQDENFNGYKK